MTKAAVGKKYQTKAYAIILPIYFKRKAFDYYLTYVSVDRCINLKRHAELQRELKQELRMKFGCYWLKRKPNLSEIKRMQIILSITEVLFA